MSHPPSKPTRRDTLKTLGALGTTAALGSFAMAETDDSGMHTPSIVGFREELLKLVEQTPFVDTHEHLPDEQDSLGNGRRPCNDWAVLLSHYLDDDLISAGMPLADVKKLTSPGLEPMGKWKLLAPYWPTVKCTGYGLAVRHAIRELYGIEDLDKNTIPILQKAYDNLHKRGYYKKILVEKANIESCQVDSCFGFYRSRQPTFLMQDISIVAMHMSPNSESLSRPTKISVSDLADWHKVIRWWFEQYGRYAVAVKSQAAYVRGLDYEKVPAEKAGPVFKKIVQKDPVSSSERKLLQDHLFWFTVDEATKHNLPVKLHLGYYAGNNTMPLGRVSNNPAQATELCRKSPQTRWVFMHIAYPYWQDLIAVAKNYTNAHIDMCWSWIIDPVGSTQFLKNYLVTAPSNKVFTFGGDYRTVECVLGHAILARRGIVQALIELVDQGWIGRDDALQLVDPIMRGNARRVFALEEKTRILQNVPWKT
jgi:predicted TIM-barrel fold metal-dependent hydrolase